MVLTLFPLLPGPVSSRKPTDFTDFGYWVRTGLTKLLHALCPAPDVWKHPASRGTRCRDAHQVHLCLHAARSCLLQGPWKKVRGQDGFPSFSSFPSMHCCGVAWASGVSSTLLLSPIFSGVCPLQNEGNIGKALQKDNNS